MRGKSSLKVEIEGNRHEIRGREGAIIPYEIEREGIIDVIPLFIWHY